MCTEASYSCMFLLVFFFFFFFFVFFCLFLFLFFFSVCPFFSVFFFSLSPFLLSLVTSNLSKSQEKKINIKKLKSQKSQKKF